MSPKKSKAVLAMSSPAARKKAEATRRWNRETKANLPIVYRPAETFPLSAIPEREVRRYAKKAPATDAKLALAHRLLDTIDRILK